MFEAGLDDLDSLPQADACRRVATFETRLEIAEFLVDAHGLEREAVPGQGAAALSWAIWLRHQRGLFVEAVQNHAPVRECQSILAPPTPTATATPAPPTATSTPVPVAMTNAPVCPTATSVSPTAMPTFTPAPRPTATPTPRPTATPTPIPSSGPPGSLEEIAARVRPSVVQVATSESSGSGVILEVSSGTAWVVTNHHVIEDDSHVRVLVDDANWHHATVHGSDSVRDLAVLSINCSSCRAVKLGAQRVRQGADVFVMGYPVFDVGEPSLTRGIVSRVFRDSSQDAWMVQTDAPINPGNSGGPLFDMDGNVVGINTFVVRQTDGDIAVEGFGFAVAAETVRMALPLLRVGSTTFAPPPTATPWRGSSSSFGPEDGVLRHDDDGYIEEYEAGVYLREFSAQAKFENPYGRFTGDWDYGFIFRASGENRFHAVVVTSDGWWSHYLREGTVETSALGSGKVSGLRTGIGDSNELRLVAAADLGWLFLNDSLLATLDLSGGEREGDVSAVTGYHEGNEIDGRSTRFTGFRVSEPRFLGERSGELEHEDDGLIEWEEMRTGTRDFIASAEFTNPYAASTGEWDYGFGFRNTGSGVFQAVVVQSDSRWAHFLREGGTDPAYQRSGRARLDVGAGGQNTMWLLAMGGAGVLYINGIQAVELDLSGNTESGDIAVATGFFEGNEITGQSTAYDDFSVWSLD